MNELERYLFDTQGYLQLDGVLNREEVARLVASIPQKSAGALISEKQPDVSNCFRGFLESPEPLFRTLINHPRVERCLSALFCHGEDATSKRYFLDHEYGFVMQPGDRGGSLLHNGATPYNTWLTYDVRERKIICGLVCVIWFLSDVNPGDGGFWCIPGSHKANFATPQALRSGEFTPACGVQPAARAGSALIFSEALAHGTRPWSASRERICLFYKY